MARASLRFLTDQQVANLHEKLMARDGGLAGYREGASLSAILERVRNFIRFGGSEFDNPTVVAAMTTYALTMGHPFNDGNKRTALVCGLVVLRVNGISAIPHPESLGSLIVATAAGEVDQEGFIRSYLDML